MKKKYIRTKDAIFTIEENIYNQVFAVNAKGEWIEFEYIENKILTEASAPEKLCDKFVITFNNKSLEPRQFKVLKTALEYLKDCDQKYCPELKGAIWTDKGLIYVLKFNDEGVGKLI